MDEVTRLALEQAWEDGYQAALSNEGEGYDGQFYEAPEWITNPYRRN